MAGNTIGQIFTLTTFGESHGPALGAVVDGCPPGIEISVEDLQLDLDRRRPGQSKYTTQRREKDQIQILSGVFEGKTTGTSIGLLIQNEDQKSKDYEDIKNIFRPAHADFTYQKKYGLRDYRGGGRSSARETSMRVAAGAIAKKFLSKHAGISVYGYLSAIGELKLACKDREFIDENPFFSGAECETKRNKKPEPETPPRESSASVHQHPERPPPFKPPTFKRTHTIKQHTHKET